MAVPIIASFALQAISNIVTSMTQPKPSIDDIKEDHGDDVLKPHADFVRDHDQVLEEGLASRKRQQSDSTSLVSLTSSSHRSAERQLLAELLQLTCSLEAQARRMILNQLDSGSQPVLVLQGDQNQQLRDIRSLGLGEDELKKIAGANEAGNSDLLNQVSKGQTQQ